MEQNFMTDMIDGKKRLTQYRGDKVDIEIPGDIQVIGSSAFQGNTRLRSITIPGSVLEIEDRRAFFYEGAFKGCENLTKVAFSPGIEKIGIAAFEDCTSLVSIEIPESVRSIGDHAFAGCSNLVAVSLPGRLEKLGWNAFGRWDRLGSVILPWNIQEASTDALANRIPPKKLSIFFIKDDVVGQSQESQGTYFSLLDETGQKIGKLYQLISSKFERFMEGLASGEVNHLSEYDALFFSTSDWMFRKCKAAICRLQYPLELEEKYYRMYVNFLQNNSSYILPSLLKTKDIPSLSCLAEINAIPIELVDGYVKEASKASALEVTAILLDYKNKVRQQDSSIDEIFTFETPRKEWETMVNVDGTLTITRYLGEATQVTIPSEIDGVKVKSIRGEMGSLSVSVFFPHIERVQSVEIEEGIQSIGTRAFLGCRNLESIKLPNSIRELGDHSFYGCTSLTALPLPEGVIEIGYGWFSNCTGLTAINLPEGLKKIGDYAFSGCTGLTGVNLPEGLEGIGDWAFSYCTGLTEVNLPEGLKEIGLSAFSGCAGLTKVNLPEGLEVIGNWAFSYCTGLIKITLPKGLKVIGNGAFSGCSGLTALALPEGLKKIGDWAFDGCDSLVVHAVMTQKKTLL